jgi:hypothetical protein
MAKKKQPKIKIFSFQDFDLKHYRLTEQYTAVINKLFDRATKEITAIAVRENYNPEKPFSFADYPNTKKYAKKIINDLAKDVQAVIETGSRKQWLFAGQKNDEFIDSIMDTSKLKKSKLNKMQDKNLEALKTFQQRKINGMDLSERVWKYTEQFKNQLELALDLGLGEGKSAAELSRDVRQYLQDPDRLFRRIKKEYIDPITGEIKERLVLSKAAKAFHPGQGVYRSSYKNAMRLTRTEVNMAYRESDYLNWQQLDFVVGFEVHRSNHEYDCVTCESLAGKYPKTFKFVGWHPQCRCYMTSILMDDKTFDEQQLAELRSALYGTEYKKLVPKNEITDVPQGFKDWVAEHAEKQQNWSTTPFFIKDNFIEGQLKKGLKNEIVSELSNYSNEFLQKPRVEQFKTLYSYDSDGKVKQHLLAKQVEDYKDIIKAAKAFAKQGEIVEIMPEIPEKEITIRSIIFPNLSSKTSNPDLKIGNTYYDVKRPIAIKNITGNANKASKQGAIVIISDSRLDKKLTNEIMQKRAIAILSKSNIHYQYKKVYFLIDDKLIEFP